MSPRAAGSRWYAAQLSVRNDPVDQGQARLGTLGEGDRDGTVQGDDGRRRHREEAVVERSDLRPVRHAVVADVAGRDGRLDLERPGPALGQRGIEQGRALGDLVMVPTCPVLLVQDHEVSGIVDPCPPSRVVDEHQRQEAQGLGFVGHEGAHGPGQPDRFGAQALAHEVGAGSGRVALVEQEVQHREDGGGPVHQQVGRRDAKGDAGVADLAFGPDQPLGHRGLGNQESTGDLRRRHAGEGAQRERDLRVEDQRRVTTGVHEAEAVVRPAIRARSVVCWSRSSRLHGASPRPVGSAACDRAPGSGPPS